jgi:serine/threonine-protein kinase ATR
LLLVLELLLKLPALLTSSKPRVWAMMATGRLVRHSRSGAHLDLSTSPYGKWCLHSHKSSVRELRIAAGYAFPPPPSSTLCQATTPQLTLLFHQPDTSCFPSCSSRYGASPPQPRSCARISSEVSRCKRNCPAGDMHSCVGPGSSVFYPQSLCWSEGKTDSLSICTEEELNIVLLSLVEYLGHTNSLVRGVAYDEVRLPIRIDCEL